MLGSQNRPLAEVDVTPSLVRALLQRQHPDLADLPLRPVSSGWDNTLLRLGDDLAVRLPRRAAAVPLIQHELRWLSVLDSGLPLAVPVPVRAGEPDETYGWPWAVVRWLPGEIADTSPPADPTQAAQDLGSFVGALSRLADDDAPANPYRGVPLAARDADLRHRLAQQLVASSIDVQRILQCWERALSAPAWDGPPMWLHGDLHPANLLVQGGRLSGVIDFGDLTGGDPATDLSVAWMLFGAADRAEFRGAAGAVDDATWARSRGNALAHAVACVASSADDPLIGAIGTRTIKAILADTD
ncbi:MAG: aminoglycoside phosphotransferase family protein [Nocardioidaceae bacterium]